MPIFSNCCSLQQYEDYFEKASKKAAKKTCTSKTCKNHVVYSEALIHCISVTLQEHQKKITVYNKKIMKKSDRKNSLDNGTVNLPSPHLHYMNVYSQQTTRPACFRSIPLMPEEVDLNEGQQDASAFENYLSDYCKKATSKPLYTGDYENVSI